MTPSTGPRTATGPWPVAIALAVGLMVRLAALPFAGTGDVAVWKIWSYSAATEGASRMYGVGATSEKPTQFHLNRFHGLESMVDYPPLVLHELGIAGLVYAWATDGRFPDTTALTVVIKAVPVVFECGLVALFVVVLRRTFGDAAAGWAVVAYCLNPAAIINASVGGYLDALFVLPAVASLMAVTGGWPALAGGLITASVLTKHQGVFIVPAVMVALWNVGPLEHRGRRLAIAAAGAGFVSAVVVGPFVAAGAWWNMVHGVYAQANETEVSMEGYNFWWIAGHFLWTGYAWQRGLSAWDVFTAPVARIPFDRAAAHGLPYLRVVGTMLAAAGILWGVWIGRRARDLSLVAAVGAFSVHAYAVLGAQVHENHLFAAMPLLIVAAAARKRFVPILVGVSAFLSLSMIFYMFSAEEGPIVLPRTLTLVDTTLLLAVFNCILLIWHAKVLQTEARA